MEKTLKRDVELLFEIGTLRNVKRSWNQLANVRFQNISEHAYRSMWTALLIGTNLKKDVSLYKVLVYTLLADIYKSRCGDHHYVSYMNVETNNSKAIEDIYGETSVEKEFVKLNKEYFLRKNTESKIAYVAGGMDNRMELEELANDGVKIASIWAYLNDKNFFNKLMIKEAKEYWESVRNSNPNQWHLASSNRFDFEYHEGAPKTQIDNDIDFLYEIGSLRHMDRLWSQFVGRKFANLTEHTYRVIWIALLIAKYLKDVNLEKVIIMAMIHDLGEIRSSDINYINSGYTKTKSDASLKQTIEKVSINKKLIKIWDELIDRNSVETKIVKDADKLDTIMELQEQEALGMQIAKEWKLKNLERLIGKLNSDYANDLLITILQSDPNSWHLSANNRFEDPDW